MDDVKAASVKEEIDCLKEIYINEMKMEYDHSGQLCLNLLLHPATAEDTEKQYVCLTLEISLPKGYPETAPCISISKPRGLSEDHLNELRHQLHGMAEQKRGEAMLFDIIELTKESLTESNRPHGICAVCQENFSENDDFNRTDCYHYFHSFCLYRYIQHELDGMKLEDEILGATVHGTKEKQVGCPVCRDPVCFDIKALSTFQESKSENFSFKPNREMCEWQRKMKTLYAKQKAKGGIIDLEEEKRKFLLPTHTAKPSEPPDRKGHATLPESLTNYRHCPPNENKNSKVRNKFQSSRPMQGKGRGYRSGRHYDQQIQRNPRISGIEDIQETSARRKTEKYSYWSRNKQDIKRPPTCPAYTYETKHLAEDLQYSGLTQSREEKDEIGSKYVPLEHVSESNASSRTTSSDSTGDVINPHSSSARTSSHNQDKPSTPSRTKHKTNKVQYVKRKDTNENKLENNMVKDPQQTSVDCESALLQDIRKMSLAETVLSTTKR